LISSEKEREKRKRDKQVGEKNEREENEGPICHDSGILV